jgi:hypothetical protein
MSIVTGNDKDANKYNTILVMSGAHPARYSMGTGSEAAGA